MNRRIVSKCLAAVLLAGSCGFASANTTTTSSVPPSTYYGTTMLEDYDNDRVFGIFPDRPVASLTIRARASTGYGLDDAQCVYYGPGGILTYFAGEKTLSFAALPKGELDRSQAAFNCSYYTHEPHGPLDWDDIDAYSVDAKDSDGAPVTVSICQLESSHDSFPLPGPGDCREACGDAICDGGEPTVLDALAVLKSALGSFSCRLRICDTNHDQAVTAADALKVLRRAVNLRSVLLCPALECEN